ncbi:MAG TPA: hypothetical protein VII99_09320 [Bacteroidia bacterium]
MKIFFTSAGIWIAFVAAYLLVAASTDEKYYMKVQGTVMQQSKCDQSGNSNILSDALVLVVDERKQVVGSYTTDKFGACSFNLPLNRRLVIKVMKNKFVPKMIELDTYVPEKKWKIYKLIFEISLFEKVKGVDATVLKEPIVKVFFNPSKEEFDYDRTYTQLVNEKLAAAYNTFYCSAPKPISRTYPDKSTSPELMALKPVVRKSTVKEKKENIIDVPTDKLIAENLEPGIVFKIQVLATQKYYPLSSALFSQFKEIGISKAEGYNKYTIGEYYNLQEAQEELKKMIDNGYDDAFLVAYQGDKQISLGKFMTSMQQVNK